MLGGLFAVLSAVAFSLNAVSIRRGVEHATPLQAAFATIVIGAGLFALASLATGQFLRADELASSKYGLLALGGIINFVGGRYLNYRAIEALGSARAAPFQAVSLPYSILIAFLFLGEGLTIAMAAGVALIIVGPIIMIERREQEPSQTSDGAGDVAVRLRQRQRAGYFFACAAAMAYGTSPILIRAAIEDDAGFALVAGLTAHTAAGLFLLGVSFLPWGAELREARQPRIFRLFLLAAIWVFIAQMLRFLALALAPIAIATALERTQIVFTLALAYWMNRTLELINLRVVLGVAASTAGALILVATLAI